jgi:YidC/Oxa1 family membrane protein insertase
MESKRMILAIALSIGLWLIWMKFFSPSKNEKQDLPPGKPAVVETQPAKAVQSEIKIVTGKVAKETEISLSTDKYDILFTNRGGAIKSFKYKERNVELVVNSNIFNAKGIFNFSLYLNADEFVQGNALEDTNWNSEKLSDNIVRFSTNLLLNGNQVRLEKIYTFNNNNYYFKIDFNIVNSSGKEIVFPNNSIIISPSDFVGPDMNFNSKYNILNQIYYLNSDFKKCDKGGGLFSKAENYKIENGEIKWAGVMSRYFLLIMLPDNFAGTGVICDARKGTGVKSGMYIAVNKMQPGEKSSRSFKVYAGEKNKDKLAAVDASLKDAADVSKWIEPIRDFLLWCLVKINLLVGNLGWSLVIFSVLSKIILLPLTVKSTQGMRKMQELSPKLNELKEKYKGKPDVLNKEMMKLYKANKVNPMSGCLPMLLQMPFFFALYSALINSIDMWQAPFIFWIKDLSMPDTVAQLFGFDINILPIIMTATSFAQSKLMPSAGAQGQQQKMMMIMPLVFIFIFWSMPSGLVLFWTLQNGLQILHQLYSERKAKLKVKEA